MDTVDELNKKVNEFREEFIISKTKMGADIMHLEEEQKELKYNICEIKQSLKDLNDKVQSLSIRLTLVISGLVTIINFVVPIILKKIL